MRPNLIRRLLLVCAVALVALLVAAAPAFAGIVVVPDQHDFGEVEVGSTASTSIEISNDWWGGLSIYGVTITGSSDFTLVNAPPPGTIVQPGSVLLMGVEFSPTAEGLATAALEVQWTNGESGTSIVEFIGTGVSTTPPTAADVLAFFDAGVEAGTIEGTGTNDRAKTIHRRVSRFALVAAGSLIERGHTGLACRLLERAYLRSDGQLSPRDFVRGADCAELNAMTLQLRADLGCL